jgi:hypothetical protein
MKNSRLIIFVIVIVAIGVLFWLSGSDRTSSETPGDIAQMTPTEAPPATQQGGGTHPLPVVESATVSVQGPGETDLGTYTLKQGEYASVEGTEYSIKLGDFYNHWNWDNGPINVSHDLRNPAVKVLVLEDGEEQYYGWAFANIEFFQMSAHGGPGGADDRYAFTLRSWEGLSFPSHGNPGE